MGKYLCPNTNCKDLGRYEEGQACPTCAQTIRKLGITETFSVSKAKRQSAGDEAALLVTADMSDEEIRELAEQDMANLAKHEAGTKWMRVGTLLSGSSTDQMLGAGFKAIIDQNKILIRQNELILRALKKE